jgi:hypothetical protein
MNSCENKMGKRDVRGMIRKHVLTSNLGIISATWLVRAYVFLAVKCCAKEMENYIFEFLFMKRKRFLMATVAYSLWYFVAMNMANNNIIYKIHTKIVMESKHFITPLKFLFLSSFERISERNVTKIGFSSTWKLSVSILHSFIVAKKFLLHRSSLRSFRMS